MRIILVTVVIPLLVIQVTPSLTLDEFPYSIILVSDDDPFFGIIGASIACSYRDNEWILKPLLIVDDSLTEGETRFIDRFDVDKPLLVIGEHIDTNLPVVEMMGSPADASIEITYLLYEESQEVLILPYDSYKLSLVASPLASYLGIPILVYDDNDDDINQLLLYLKTCTAYVVGDISPQISSTITQVHLRDTRGIQEVILGVIKQRFRGINYITLTNPLDVKPTIVINTTKTAMEYHIKDIEVTLLGKTFGSRKTIVPLSIPDGILRIRIYGNITESKSIMNSFAEPVIKLELFDSKNRISAYAPSFAFDIGRTLLDTLIVDNPGRYNLTMTLYHGFKGGFFTSRGLSIVDCIVNITIIIDELLTPHYSLIPKLSMITPYLTMAHGGIIIADENFSLTTSEYIDIAAGYPSGPWYTEELQEYNNEKVNYTVSKIRETLRLLGEKDLLDDYLSGPAWLAIVGDTNMIPMYYYQPSQQDIYEQGLPSDNPYSLGEKLSIGRIVSYSVEDASLLVCRTLFYEELCRDDTSWLNSFNFLFGEGYGETGGIFHQIPYSKEIRKYGFNTSVYGDLRNSREIIRRLGVFNSNYIEYMGHGDWFWFIPSIYGLDYYSKVFDVSHMRNWVFKPSVFLTAACLMGRIDGIPSYMSIGLTLLHAGCNCFIGATRETGREAGLTILENSLLLNDTSIGEALRAEKQIDKEPPTYYVRVLYGDPAFNPYEPLNGFSNQGRP